jgi:acid phosphatase family membrane protein YuiD
VSNNAFYEMVTNQALVIPLSAWAMSQLLKVFVVLGREKRFDLWFLIRSGGMPSSHTALVWALVTVVAITQGFNSAIFAVAAMLAAVVTYDAAGVRQAVGQQSIILNRIIKEFRIKRPRGEMERDLREFIGHTPFQVIAGATLGIFIAWLWLKIVAI